MVGPIFRMYLMIPSLRTWKWRLGRWKHRVVAWILQLRRHGQWRWCWTFECRLSGSDWARWGPFHRGLCRRCWVEHRDGRICFLQSRRPLWWSCRQLCRFGWVRLRVRVFGAQKPQLRPCWRTGSQGGRDSLCALMLGVWRLRSQFPGLLISFPTSVLKVEVKDWLYLLQL